MQAVHPHQVHNNQVQANQVQANQVQADQTEEAQIIQSVHCPNCGSSAERHYLLTRQLTRTQCPACDYLMITCSLTARVIEAHAPGIFLSHTSPANFVAR